VSPEGLSVEGAELDGTVVGDVEGCSDGCLEGCELGGLKGLDDG